MNVLLAPAARRRVVRFDRRVSPCPACGAAAKRHSLGKRRLREVGSGAPVVLEVHYSKHYCGACRKHFSPPLDGLARPSSRYTERVRLTVMPDTAGTEATPPATSRRRTSVHDAAESEATTPNALECRAPGRNTVMPDTAGTEATATADASTPSQPDMAGPKAAASSATRNRALGRDTTRPNTTGSGARATAGASTPSRPDMTLPEAARAGSDAAGMPASPRPDTGQPEAARSDFDVSGAAEGASAGKIRTRRAVPHDWPSAGTVFAATYFR